MAESRLLSPADVRRLAAELDLRPTKAKGQNFVIDPNTVRMIAARADVGPNDVVLEVGPGLGSLTLALLPLVRRVIAVEIEPALATRLPYTAAEFAPAVSDRLTVVCGDALHLPELPGPAPTALVANLPYNVAVPVLLEVLAAYPTIERGLVMVQKEVADRLCAAPGSRVYGVPSVKLAWYADAAPAGTVSASVFWPAPRVASGLVRF
ncbi:MAG: 16S rRNA (adenine(1518)-N(6)/adenine(1519)-N(6))-dimethyltransferase RsmA, partial [Candidatus Nanopelagicales bacterium]